MRLLQASVIIIWLPLVSALVSGCATTSEFLSREVKLTEAPLPRESGPNQQVLAALKCINDSGVLRKRRFAVAVHADGTGKTAAGYEGATGSFLPQGTSAMWVTQAVMYAGGVAQNYYELNTERAIRQFGGEDVAKHLADRQAAQMPDFVVSTAFTALDFLGGPSVDLRVAGVGPNFDARGASIEVSAELYRPGDRTTLALSSVSRPVIYTSSGIGLGRFFGSNTLVTGGISATDQQRLQEAARDAIAYSVADLLSRVPGVPRRCRAAVEALSNPPPEDRLAGIRPKLSG